MSRFIGVSEKSVFLKKNLKYGWSSMGSGCYRLKFLAEIRLHWLFHVGFGEIRFIKRHDVINSNSWFWAILREFSGFLLFMLIFFFLKLNIILTNIYISCVETRVLDPPPPLSHQLVLTFLFLFGTIISCPWLSIPSSFLILFSTIN